MMRMLRALVMTSAALVVVCAGAGTARADNDRNPQSAIVSASVSADQSMLLVTGAGFGTAPAVVLNGLLLGGVTVNAKGTALTAIMPALPPGSYLLVVQRNRPRRHDNRHDDDDDSRVATFVLTVGAVGPKGDQGDQGDQGVQGEKGDPGDQGIQGEKGDQGDQGLRVSRATKEIRATRATRDSRESREYRA